MNVTVMSATERPIETISLAAGVCFGKSNVSATRVANCYRAGHMSVFEHASVTFRVEGISRACMAQLTRHRLVSFAVESQRYNRYELRGNGWYVTPPSMEQTDCYVNGRKESFADAYFEESMRCSAKDYLDALEHGIKPEDARYLLPEATKTNLVMTCNVRELFHILDTREARDAQWEIRDLAKAMREACEGINDEWRELMGVRA